MTEVIEVRADGEHMQVFGGPASGFRIVKWQPSTDEKHLHLRLEREAKGATAVLHITLDIRDVLGLMPNLINGEASKVLR